MPKNWSKLEYRFPKLIYLPDISPFLKFFGDISPKWRYIVKIHLQNGDIKGYIFIFRRYISISQKIYITKMQIYLDISSFFRGCISPFLEIICCFGDVYLFMPKDIFISRKMSFFQFAHESIRRLRLHESSEFFFRQAKRREIFC